MGKLSNRTHGAHDLAQVHGVVTGDADPSARRRTGGLRPRYWATGDRPRPKGMRKMADGVCYWNAFRRASDHEAQGYGATSRAGCSGTCRTSGSPRLGGRRGGPGGRDHLGGVWARVLRDRGAGARSCGGLVRLPPGSTDQTSELCCRCLAVHRRRASLLRAPHARRAGT